MNSQSTEDTKPADVKPATDTKKPAAAKKELTAADVAKKAGKLTYITGKGKEAKVTGEAILSFRADGKNIHFVTIDGRKHLIEG